MALGIWNRLDEAALYVGISRFPGETNAELHNRIRKFSQWKYGTGYETLSRSVPVQAALNISPTITITSNYRFECSLDWDYFTLQSFPDDDTQGEYLRIFVGAKDCLVTKIYSALLGLTTVSTSSKDSTSLNADARFMIRSSNTRSVVDFIDANSCTLQNKNIIRNSFQPADNIIFSVEKESLQDLKAPGDYFVDYKAGFVSTYTDIPSGGVSVSYKCFDSEFNLEVSELAFVPVNVIAKYGLSDELIEYIPDMLNNRVWGK